MEGTGPFDPDRAPAPPYRPSVCAQAAGSRGRRGRLAGQEAQFVAPFVVGSGHDYAGQRALVTFTFRQRMATGQAEQRGEIGVQTFWPKETSRSL